MFDLEIERELEFIEPATADGTVIPKGTHVRVGAIMTAWLEQKVMLDVHGGNLPETLTVSRNVLTRHCRQVQKPR